MVWSPGRQTESSKHHSKRQGGTLIRSCSTRTKNRIWWTLKATKALRTWPQSLAEHNRSWKLRKTPRSIQVSMWSQRNLTNSSPSRLKSWPTSKLSKPLSSRRPSKRYWMLRTQTLFSWWSQDSKCRANGMILAVPNTCLRVLGIHSWNVAPISMMLCIQGKEKICNK